MLELLKYVTGLGLGESLEVRGGDDLTGKVFSIGLEIGYLCLRGVLVLIGDVAFLREMVEGLAAISALDAMSAIDFLFSALTVRER
jgi:hypothetical protein